MAVTLQLTDGTTTHNLNGSTYAVRAGTFDPGNPGSLRSEASNLLRNGWDLRAFGLTKRVMSMDLAISSASLSAQSTNVMALNEALRKAREYQMHGWGSQWQLQLDTGSGTTISFNVQTGSLSLDPGDLIMPFAFDSTPEMLAAHLVLECDPLGEGPEESVLNYVADPSFEVAGTALADWTENIDANHTATTSRSTAQSKYGNASLLLSLTNSAGAGSTYRYQNTDVGSFAEGDVASFAAWVNVTALNALRVRLSIDWYTSGSVYISSAGTADLTATTSGWTQLSVANKTAPATTSYVRIHVSIMTDAASQTGTVYWDGVLAVKASSVPTTWASGKDVANHFDDDGQAHLCYIDVHDVGGDYPAKVQVKITDDEAHTVVWVGARHVARQYDDDIMHEGEDFADWDTEPADATAQGGNYGRVDPDVVLMIDNGTATNTDTCTVAADLSTLAGENLIMLIGVALSTSGTAASPTTVTFNGDSCTLAIAQNSANRHASIWYIENPDKASGNIVATFAATHECLGVGAIVVSEYDRNDPIGDTTAADGAGAPLTLDITSVQGDLVMDCFSQINVTSSTPGAGQTEHVDQNTTYGGRGLSQFISTENATGTTTTMSQTPSTANNWAGVGVALNKATASSPAYVVKTVSTPPTGTYRALARVRANGTTTAFNVAIGYKYGEVEYMPSLAGHYTTIAAATSGWHLLDIGMVRLPPSTLPDGATIASVDLRFCWYYESGNPDDDLELDYILLRPVDAGDGYVSKTSGTDVTVLDTISRSPHIGRWNTSDVFQERPTQEGDPPYIDPDGTRLYILTDDGVNAAITNGVTVEVRVIPRFMNIG